MVLIYVLHFYLSALNAVGNSDHQRRVIGQAVERALQMFECVITS